MLNSRVILFVSQDSDAFAVRLAQALYEQGAYLSSASKTMQALGQYITYVPHATVIDMRAPAAAEVLHHLTSIDAEPLIILTDEPELRQPEPGMFYVPRSLDGCALVEVIDAVIEGASVMALRRLYLKAV